jgi:tetraacyldisaccharide 4'-kinase
LELELELPDVPHVQNPDRVSAARVAIEQFQSQLVLLDDAFQHRRIARDLDIVLVDALEPFGYEHLLPRGLLREPLSGLSRAHVVAISRCDLVDPSVRQAIVRQLREHAPDALVIEVAHCPRGLVNSDGQRADIASLDGTSLAAFCGIGNALGFRRTLESVGQDPAGFREFADHHVYSTDDIQSLTAWATNLPASNLVCTRKDLVKVGATHLGSIPLWALEIGLQIVSGREDLEERLQSVLAAADLPSTNRES